MARSGPAVLALVLLAACGDEVAEPGPRPDPPAAPAPIAASRQVAGPASFALVPAGEGALFVWGASPRAGGGVRALPLGPLGEASVAEVVLAPGGAAEERRGPVVELDASAAGRRVGVAWVTDHGVAHEVEATYSLDGGRTFAAPEDLGPTVPTPRGRRAHLDMATHDDGALVLYHRIPARPCVASEGTCARFTRTSIGGGASSVRRGTEPLEVRHPCDPLVSGALWHGGTGYYAVCHADPVPSTLVYAIRPAVHYAAPIALPAGCTPLGIAPLDVGVAVLTRCGDRTTATHLDEMGRVLGRFDPAERSVACDEGRPALVLGRGGSARRLHLEGARDDLAPLLPESIAPPGARAIWTGEALLVAVHARGDVSLHRYACAGGGRFVRTDVR